MSEQAQNLNENEELVEEVQQETTATEDPLEEAIARVQELEEQLKAQVEETSKKEQDLLLRTRAEIDNMRRRSEQDIEKAHKFALEKFSKDILNTIDNLERALATPANKEDENIKALFDGVELTLKELLASVSSLLVLWVIPLIQIFTKLSLCNQQKALQRIKSPLCYKKVIP